MRLRGNIGTRWRAEKNSQATDGDFAGVEGRDCTKYLCVAEMGGKNGKEQCNMVSEQAAGKDWSPPRCGGCASTNQKQPRIRLCIVLMGRVSNVAELRKSG